MKKFLALSIIFSFLFHLSKGEDTLRVFTLKDVYGLVLSNHPIVQQAFIVSSIGDLELMASRGAFDPQLKTAYDEKTFQGKDYWKIWQNVSIWTTIVNWRQ